MRRPNKSSEDYIRFCMSGNYATEVSDASGTLLLDVVNREWSHQILEVLRFDAHLLPKMHESQEVTGLLHAEAARSMGLVEGIPVVGGAGDQAAGAVGNGIVRSGIVSATYRQDALFFSHADCCRPSWNGARRAGTRTNGASSAACCRQAGCSSGSATSLGKPEIALAKKKKVDPYQLLIEEAASAPAGSEGLQFLPYLTGERCPYPNPNARGGWIGITSRTTRAMMIRSLLEGVTFGMNDAPEIMANMKIETAEVRASGGGAVRLLADRKSRHLQRPPRHHQRLRRPRIRRRTAGRRWHRRVEQRRRSLQCHDPADRKTQAQQKVRIVVSAAV